eukprot:TRINITY_DN4647_c0_g5_i1.p1 TRINITY_DN4647_c0_g5~~TRINITY_DN4647_c0_g5_i1.p1  ORF type:complete len:335 (-),score=52.87 TRINITY_DN4647_c0_g5_i1:315-1319(-)
MEWFVQMLLALSYCHSQGVTHHNLSSKSVLFTTQGYVKVGNFGIGSMPSIGLRINDELMYEAHYFAPEITQEQAYTFKSDVWSLGVILYEMCMLELPFVDRSLVGLAVKIRKGAFNPIEGDYSNELKEFITSMLAVDPDTRPNLSQLLGDLFINSIEKDYIKQQLKRFLEKVEAKPQFVTVCSQYAELLSGKSEELQRSKLNIKVIKLANKKLPVIRGKLVLNKDRVLKKVKSESTTLEKFFDEALLAGRAVNIPDKGNKLREISEEDKAIHSSDLQHGKEEEKAIPKMVNITKDNTEVEDKQKEEIKLKDILRNSELAETKANKDSEDRLKVI